MVTIKFTDYISGRFNRLGRSIQKIIDAIRGKERHIEDATPPDATPPDATPPVESGNNRFLWKPESESRQGRAAVLLPANIERATLLVNQEPPAEIRGRTNGNRLTFFLKYTGAAYGKNVNVIASDAGNVIQTWNIPDGSKRWER